MIIDKSISDTVLVNSLRVFGSSGKPLVKIKLFNTDTLQATHDDDQTEVCSDYGFYVGVADEDAIKALLDVSLHPRVVFGHKTAHGSGPASMDYNVADPDHLLVSQSNLVPILVECTSCDTNFVIFVDYAGELWASQRAQPADKHLTATKLDKSLLACDNCSQSVTLAED